MKKWFKQKVSDKSRNKGLDKFMNKITETVDIRFQTNDNDSSTSPAVSRLKRNIKELYICICYCR